MVIMNHLLENISSYDGNVLLAAVVSLLLVILLVLLLHVYAKWFLAQAPRRGSSPMSASHVFLPAARFHHFHSFTTTSDPNNTTSVDPNSFNPLFVFRTSSSRDDRDDDEYNMNMQGGVGGFGSECVICLSGFEECDVGRCLPKCGHAFHVECIDMWLHSHSNCPICRAPVVAENINNNEMVRFTLTNSSIEEAAPGTAVELLSVIAVEGVPRLTESSAATDHRRHQVNNGRR